MQNIFGENYEILLKDNAENSSKWAYLPIP